MSEEKPIGVLFHDKVCPTCKQRRTREGHDPCLGHLPGVKFACCGHGMREGYIVFENDVIIRFVATEIENEAAECDDQHRFRRLIFNWSK